MEKRHKDILVSKRPELVENLNVRDGLYTQLMARRILSSRMVRTIQHGRSPDQQTEELLNILPTRGPNAFKFFCESLIADDQEEIVNLYLQDDKTEGESSGCKVSKDAGENDRSSPILIAVRKDDLQKYSFPMYSKSTLEQMEQDNAEIISPPFEPNETRHVLKHYVAEPPPPYQLMPDKTIPVKDLPKITQKRIVNRVDTLDAMNKRTQASTSSEHCDNDETGAPRKRLRREENDDESEDEGIDLTDGPINVEVEPCERSFYLQNYKKAYPMNQIPRGKAIIINVNEVVGKGPRKGTDIDRDNMKLLLSQLDFQVEAYNDSDGLTAREIVLKLQEFSQDEIHESANCTVIVMLSHGEEGSIFGTDGIKIPMSGIFAMFDNANSPSLVGKPKLFFIQACRGGALDKGVSCDETDGGRDMSDAKLPSQSDMLVCYPTQEGYYAWRNRDRGSWYIEGVVQVFMKYAKKEDICTMLNRVNHLVSKKLSRSLHSEMDQMTQMSEYKSSLRKPHFFFFPGIASG